MKKDIAIVGFSGRFPGAKDIYQFWNNLKEKRVSITEIPSSRFDMDSLYDPDHRKPGKISCKWGGFLKDIDLFDNSFFNINKREASCMDPQQRLFSEQTWRAFETAGFGPSRLKKYVTGVFAGVGSQEYMWQLMKSDAPAIHYSVTGTGRAFIANRISHFFDFKGPSMTVDTACSSSLTAVYLGRQAILSGECDVAVAGGVNLTLEPFLFIGFTKAAILSKSGNNRIFDRNADGYVRGEGVGVVILKSMDLALKDQDTIYAVIKDISLNHHGTGYSITAPSLKSQTALFKKIYGRINPERVSYIEAGSTGSIFGDPVEIRALKNVFKEFTSKKEFCAIGSVKPNIGHLEAASGICGLIKVLLCLKNGILPGLAGFSSPNKYINLKDSPFYINRETSTWNACPKMAGITSFGFAGTDIHILIEEYKQIKPGPEKSRSVCIAAISAKKKKSFENIVQNLKERVSKTLDSIEDICYTQTGCREHFKKFRTIFTVKSKEELISKLNKAFKDQNRSEKIPAGLSFINNDPIEQKQLYDIFDFLKDTEPLFKKHADICLKTLNDICPKPDIKKNKQLIFFIVRYSLAKMFIDLGLAPNKIIGTGHGKYLSDIISNLFSLKQGLELFLKKPDLDDPKNFENTDPAKKSEKILDKSEKVLYLEIGKRADFFDSYNIIPFFDKKIKKEYIISQRIEDLYMRGINIRWDMYYKGTRQNRIKLPGYPFDRERCWVD